MSASPAQIHANQRNAQKSTGPRTEEGKRRISQNALTHGLTAQTLCLDEESSDAFYTLRRRMLEDLAPQGEIECQLAEQMIAARWRLMRSWETETDLYNQALEANTAELPTIRRRTQAFQQLTANGDVDKLGRYENRLSRDYDRCLRRITELKTARQRRQEQERKERDRLPTPINHTDLLSADEYIRLQRKEKPAPAAPGQNKPNTTPPASPEPAPTPRPNVQVEDFSA